MTDARSPFVALGGLPVITAVLDDLYRRIFADPMIGFLFEGHDREHIVRMQSAFTARMLGDESAVYEGKSIPEAHDRHPILPGHFDRRHFLLRQVLEAHHVAEAPREAWLRLDAALRPAVLKAGKIRIDELRWRPE